MADITTIEKNVNNSIARQTSAFIRDNTNTFNSLGRTRGGLVNIEPVLSEADSAGRDSVLAYDVSGTIILMQTSKNEIAVVGALSAPDGTNYPNGHYLFFSDEPTNDPDSNADGTPDVDGFAFANVLPKVTSEINFSGEESMITIEFQGRVPTDVFDFDPATTTPITITFDA